MSCNAHVFIIRLALVTDFSAVGASTSILILLQRKKNKEPHRCEELYYYIKDENYGSFR